MSKHGMSFRKKKPETGKFVLYKTKNTYAFGFYTNEDPLNQINGIICVPLKDGVFASKYIISEPITHWMELPEPPYSPDLCKYSEKTGGFIGGMMASPTMKVEPPEVKDD